MRRPDRPAIGTAIAVTGGAAVDGAATDVRGVLAAADGADDGATATAGAASVDGDGATVVERALEQLRGAVDSLAAVDESTLPDGCVARAVRELSVVDGRLEGLQARLTRAAAASGVPERSGATSTVDWVRTMTGRSGRHAARTDRMARTMDDSPELAERLSTGKVGPDQADRIARGLDRGTLDPSDAADLLQYATHLPPGPFDREAKRLEGRRHQRRLREQEQAAHDARSGRRWRDEDDSLHLDFQLAPPDGDVVEKALNAFVQPDPAGVPDDQRRTHRQLLADALVDMSRTVLQQRLAREVGGVRPQCSVIVGPEMLLPLDEAEQAGATAVSDLDTVLSAAAAQQLLCDATFRRIVVDAQGQVLDVGRATRKWSGAIRAAITALDGGDRTPGSELPPERCEIHHITFWEQGGDTSVANGVLLSKRGHDMVHIEGWRLHMDPTTRVCTWTSPDGDTTVRTYPRGAAAGGAGAPHDIPALREPGSHRARPDRTAAQVRPPPDEPPGELPGGQVGEPPGRASRPPTGGAPRPPSGSASDRASPTQRGAAPRKRARPPADGATPLTPDHANAVPLALEL